MLIEIKGIQFVNKGAELMLYAVLDKISELWPDAQICIEPDVNSPFEKRARIGAFQKLRLVKNRFDFNGLSYCLPSRFRSYLKQTLGIVTEADVDLILDASGFLYGDQWNYLPLKQSSSIANRFKQKNKPYVLLPQAFGPFSSAKYQAAAKVLVDNAALVYARDDKSLAHTQHLSSNPNLQLGPDFTNLLVPKALLEYRALAGKVAIIPNCKMVSQSNKNDAWRENYVRVLANIINSAQKAGNQVFLLNHEGKGDLALCKKINAELEHPISIVSPDSCIAIKTIIGQCAWVVSSRYHGCVSALSQQVPCIGTSWSHKYEALFKDYEHLNWLVDIELSEEALTQYIVEFALKAKENSNALREPAKDIKQKAEKVWHAVKDSV